jgi:E3 ubiquitin-protein ligase RNFT1
MREPPVATLLCAGAQCAICQDAPSGPLRLECSHIFCERCVSEWLERERTCPMCRCTVRHDTFQSYGNGTTSLLPSVF